MRLVLAVIQSADGSRSYQISPRSAHRRRRSRVMPQWAARTGSMVVGVDDDQVSDVLTLSTRARGRVRRIEPLRPLAGRAEFWIPGPAEQGAGGASVFVLPVRRFERIGYA